MPQYLFVYGTLQPGLAPQVVEPLVSQFRLVGRASICGILYDLGTYPGAVLREGKAKVWGQVFALPEEPELLRRLDAYEDFDPRNIDGSQFVREECMARLETGEEVKVWIYVYNRRVDKARRILDGDYGRFRKENSRIALFIKDC